MKHANPRLVLGSLTVLSATLVMACGESRASHSAGESPTRATQPPSAHLVPVPRVEGLEPVGDLLDWTRQLLEAARSQPGIPSRTPEELLDFLAKAEREGDAAAFAAGLLVEDEAYLPWAAGMLLPQASRRAHDELIALLRERQPDSPVTGQAIAARTQRREGLSQSRVENRGNASGFFLPDGTCLMKVTLTSSGWRVAPGSRDELLTQPRKGIASMLPDLAFWARFRELVEAKPAVDLAELSQEAMQHATQVGERARRELER